MIQMQFECIVWTYTKGTYVALMMSMRLASRLGKCQGNLTLLAYLSQTR